jgi:hypothetical protein
MKTCEHNHPNIPQCQKSSENRNIIPDLPVEFRCSWGDCQVNSSSFINHTTFFSSSLLIVMLNFFMNMLINMLVPMCVVGQVKIKGSS